MKDVEDVWLRFLDDRQEILGREERLVMSFDGSNLE